MKIPAALLVAALLITTAPAFAQSTDEQQPPPAQPAPIGLQPTSTKPDPAPKHVSTSWKSLIRDSAEDYWRFPQRKSTWVILAIGAGAAAIAYAEPDDYVQEHIVGNPNADKFFKLGKIVGSSQVQVGSAVGLWAVGRYLVPPVSKDSRTNKISEMGFDLMRAHLLSQGLVQGIKVAVQRPRPTGECCSFPSGHSAAAFAAASVLERHLGYRGSWPAILGAFYVGASRLVDNRHFLSDVMFGAAVGTASGWTVVGRDGWNEIQVQPVPVNKGMMLEFSVLPRDQKRP